MGLWMADTAQSAQSATHSLARAQRYAAVSHLNCLQCMHTQLTQLMSSDWDWGCVHRQGVLPELPIMQTAGLPGQSPTNHRTSGPRETSPGQPLVRSIHSANRHCPVEQGDVFDGLVSDAVSSAAGAVACRISRRPEANFVAVSTGRVRWLSSTYHLYGVR
jgi:hypothetical protein